MRSGPFRCVPVHSGYYTHRLINGNGCLELKESFHILSNTDFRCLANKTSVVFLTKRRFAIKKSDQINLA